VPEEELAQADRAELVAAVWERMITEVQEAMRASGHAEPAIQQVVAHIRARQYPDAPEVARLEGHVVAEFGGEAPSSSGQAGHAGQAGPSSGVHDPRGRLAPVR
ncbi:MAG TPA: hypothetical protein VGR57_21585, partial [Ktedonobacterales bacterium]|nr:hypothetical protein [Ktedonobacterales bacterium]